MQSITPRSLSQSAPTAQQLSSPSNSSSDSKVSGHCSAVDSYSYSNSAIFPVKILPNNELNKVNFSLTKLNRSLKEGSELLDNLVFLLEKEQEKGNLSQKQKELLIQKIIEIKNSYLETQVNLNSDCKKLKVDCHPQHLAAQTENLKNIKDHFFKLSTLINKIRILIDSVQKTKKERESFLLQTALSFGAAAIGTLIFDYIFFPNKEDKAIDQGINIPYYSMALPAAYFAYKRIMTNFLDLRLSTSLFSLNILSIEFSMYKNALDKTFPKNNTPS